MSILPPITYDPGCVIPLDFKVQDHAIGGKLCHASFSMNLHFQAMHSEQGAKQHIREQMAISLALQMMEKGLIEFTKLDNPLDNVTRLHARVYLAPTDQIKILRTHSPS
jgi:hypothetical protein